jgi:hypothetical protein
MIFPRPELEDLPEVPEFIYDEELDLPLFTGVVDRTAPELSIFRFTGALILVCDDAGFTVLFIWLPELDPDDLTVPILLVPVLPDETLRMLPVEPVFRLLEFTFELFLLTSETTVVFVRLVLYDGLVVTFGLL